jgi:uroporphyrinogen decarboxylase
LDQERGGMSQRLVSRREVDQATRPMTGRERMLGAARGKEVDATPVWFMRQAGRSLAAYRALRERHDVLTLAKTPELCARVTLMPVEQLGVDGAVMFADIMLPLDGMGVPFHIEPDVGPIIERPLRSVRDVAGLRVVAAEEATPYVFEAIRLVRDELGSRAALIGFAGAPFTLACYLIEGRPSRDFARAKAFLYAEPAGWHRLMETLTEVIVRYLRAQVAAGAEIIQLFDSWVGAIGPIEYERDVLPYSRRIFSSLGGAVPTIHFGTGNSSLLALMAEAGSHVVSVDWRTPLDEAWRAIGLARGIQGNLDPAVLLAPFSVVERSARDVLARAAGRPGHIFNLGHGVAPETDAAQLAELVALVHESTRR